MKIEEIYIDLSKCTEEEQKHIISLLPEPEKTDYYEVYNNYKYLQFIPESVFGNNRWMVDKQAFGKTELTYPEFIKLFERGEGEIPDPATQLQADKAELLEALEKLLYGEFFNNVEKQDFIETLIQKHKK